MMAIAFRETGNLDPAYVTQKLSAPHTWHAAEVLLYLLNDPQLRSLIPTDD
jgi:hypothetical protein